MNNCKWFNSGYCNCKSVETVKFNDRPKCYFSVSIYAETFCKYFAEIKYWQISAIPRYVFSESVLNVEQVIKKYKIIIARNFDTEAQAKQIIDKYTLENCYVEAQE